MLAWLQKILLTFLKKIRQFSHFLKSDFVAVPWQIYVLSLFFLWWSFSLPLPDLKTRVTACDVGQGDAVLIQHGTWTMLIDSGPNSDVLQCLTQKLPWWRPKIDILVLTHSDWDHIGGVEAVLSSFRVGEVWKTAWTDLSASGQKVEALMESQPQRVVFAGESLSLPGMRWRVLWGEKSREIFLPGVDVESETNSKSVALIGQGESFGFLGLGDLECAEELAVGEYTLLTEVTVLKVSHHGSKSSTCLEFLRKIKPETAIISSGEGNSYGHPHPFTLENLSKTGVFVLRTDQLGTFTLDADRVSGSFQMSEE